METVTGVKCDGIRKPGAFLIGLPLKWLRQAITPHMGGVSGLVRTCKGAFAKYANRPPSLDSTGLAMKGIQVLTGFHR